MIHAHVPHKQSASTSACARNRRVFNQGRVSTGANLAMPRHHSLRKLFRRCEVWVGHSLSDSTCEWHGRI
jgi:hypothetical protein